MEAGPWKLNSIQGTIWIARLRASLQREQLRKKAICSIFVNSFIGLAASQAVQSQHRDMTEFKPGRADSGRCVTMIIAGRSTARRMILPISWSDVGSIQLGILKSSSSGSGPTAARVALQSKPLCAALGPIGDLQRRITVAEGIQKKAGDQRRRLSVHPGRSGETCLELVELLRPTVGAHDARHAFDVADEGVEGAVHVKRRAEILQVDERGAAEPVTERLGDARLAEAWRRREQHELTLAALRLIPAPLQQRDLLVASDQGRQGLAGLAVEGLASAAFADDAPEFYRAGEFLEFWGRNPRSRMPRQPAAGSALPP